MSSTVSGRAARGLCATTSPSAVSATGSVRDLSVIFRPPFSGVSTVCGA
jgi:hypothetical protein